MRTSRAAALLLLVLAAPAPAQVEVDGATEVRTIRFAGVEELHDRRLRAVLQTRDRGSLYGLRVALGKLPFVPSPAHHTFLPLVLQQDVARMRQVYAAAGFFRTSIRYDVERDDARNLLDIRFVVEEGPPLIVTDIVLGNADSLSALPVAEGDRKSWARLERQVLQQQGHRLEISDARANHDRLQRWWRDRGHPLARVLVRMDTDSARSTGVLTYRVAIGAAARFGELRLEGSRAISEATLRRLVPIEPGDTYSVSALDQARLNLQQLDIVRVASVEVPTLDTTAAPTTPGPGAAGAALLEPLPVRVSITEADRRLIMGGLGYVTDAGVSADARWQLRDFSGGGRSLTVTGLAQNGWLSPADNPDIRYRMAAALKQPAFLARRVSAVLTPFVEHRDDAQDRSTQFGLNATLVRQTSSFRSVALDYQIAVRDIHEYRFGDLASGEIDLLTFLTQVAQGALDELGSRLNSSTFTLSGTWGALDDAANPRRGYLVRPAVQVTAPTAWSSTAFSRLQGTFNGFVPLGRRVTFISKANLGWLHPFGKSVPGPNDDPTVKFLQLRDAAFTAGGTGDVRGWENRLLGPKAPDVRFEIVAGDTLKFADGYVPLGGFSRASFSVELGVPLPGLGPNFGTHVFLDGGRVWTNDSRFALQDEPYGQDRFFYAAGAGLDLRTPVGPIKLGFGYKLNPSIIDLVDAADLLAAGDTGTPISDLPQHNSRRWQYYLAIGASY